MTALRELDGDLADVLSQGLRMEVLSWKLTQEEPQGCSQISQDLNMGNEIAVAIAEATALATLSETVTFALQSSNMLQKFARKVAYDAVKKNVVVEVNDFVFKESFIDIFEYVMNTGANTAPFIPKLVTFTSVWVNSGFKRLPLTAFKEANKITNEVPVPESSRAKVRQSDVINYANLSNFYSFVISCWGMPSHRWTRRPLNT